jgi:hypothetical protein|tara:strand:+ start:50 stop:622 length:573 start_codon:yes stop_codon:yes gene_type:complete
MNKKILLIIILFAFCLVNAQRRNHTFFMNDGNKVIYQNVKSKFNKPYYIVRKEDGTEFKIHYNEFYRYEYEIKKCGICKDYIKQAEEIVKLIDESYYLLPVTLDGKCKIYLGPKPNSFSGNSRYLYVKRDGEEYATMIGANTTHRTNFKQVALEYFSDCEMMKEKINKRFRKSGKRLYEVIEFYNEHCGN